MNQLWNELDLASRVRLVTEERFMAKLKDVASNLPPGVLDVAPNMIVDSPKALITVWKAIDLKYKSKLLNFLRTSKIAKDLKKWQKSR